MAADTISAKTVAIKLKDIPSTLHNNDLNNFCSLFGKVNCVKYSTTKKSSAIVEFENNCFFDSNFFTYLYDTPFTPAGKINECFLNDRFLSDLLSILGNTNVESKNVTSSFDDRNHSNMDEENDAYNICAYCYSCADFQCERCESPYCSIKCQKLDWLIHKKTCSPKSQTKSGMIVTKKNKIPDHPRRRL